jgi:hypothetical protein
LDNHVERLRTRYTVFDRERGGIGDVAPVFVLKPWSNPADFAALDELKNHVPPEFAESIEAMLSEIEKHPGRACGSFGTACLPHVKHPRVQAFARQRLKELENR